MMYRIFFIPFFIVCFVDAGTSTQHPPSDPIPVERYSPQVYIGGGATFFQLDDDITQERLSSGSMLLLAGYQFSKYISLEARYYRSLGDTLAYDAGSRPSPDASYESMMTNVAGFMRVSQPIAGIEVYGLLGYGTVKLTNIAGGDREESGMQYGVGFSYHLSENLELFADWVRAYNGNGFDGRAKKDKITVDLYSGGLRYKF